MSSQSAIFLFKTEARVSVCYGGTRGGRARAPESFGGRGFKWREPRHSLGRKPFKPQTALLRWSRAVGLSRCPPATGERAHASVRLVTERVLTKAARSTT